MRTCKTADQGRTYPLWGRLQRMRHNVTSCCNATRVDRPWLGKKYLNDLKSSCNASTVLRVFSQPQAVNLGRVVTARLQVAGAYDMTDPLMGQGVRIYAPCLRELVLGEVFLLLAGLIKAKPRGRSRHFITQISEVVNGNFARGLYSTNLNRSLEYNL